MENSSQLTSLIVNQVLVMTRYFVFRKNIDLSRNTSIDPFVESTARRVDSKGRFVLFEECNVVLRETFDLVDILDRGVRPVASNHPGSMREHPAKRLVVALTSSMREFRQ